MRADTKKLKSRWRKDHTHTVLVQVEDEEVKVRHRNPDAPSLKQWADQSEGGRAWIARKRTN